MHAGMQRIDRPFPHDLLLGAWTYFVCQEKMISVQCYRSCLTIRCPAGVQQAALFFLRFGKNVDMQAL